MIYQYPPQRPNAISGIVGDIGPVRPDIGGLPTALLVVGAVLGFAVLAAFMLGGESDPRPKGAF